VIKNVTKRKLDMLLFKVVWVTNSRKIVVYAAMMDV